MEFMFPRSLVSFDLLLSLCVLVADRVRRWSEFVSAGRGYVFAEEFEQLPHDCAG